LDTFSAEIGFAGSRSLVINRSVANWLVSISGREFGSARCPMGNQ
jgi:hypothetical protein